MPKLIRHSHLWYEYDGWEFRAADAREWPWDYSHICGKRQWKGGAPVDPTDNICIACKEKMPDFIRAIRLAIVMGMKVE